MCTPAQFKALETALVEFMVPPRVKPEWLMRNLMAIGIGQGCAAVISVSLQDYIIDIDMDDLMQQFRKADSDGDFGCQRIAGWLSSQALAQAS